MLPVAASRARIRSAGRAGCAASRAADAPAAHALAGALIGVGPAVEAILGTDTARARWPLQVALLDTLPVAAELDDDTTGTGITDSITLGRAVPGGTYDWFFPTGTRATVTGRRNDDLRLRLSPDAEAWVPAIDARPLAPGGPGAAGGRRLGERDAAAPTGPPCASRSPSGCRSGSRRPSGRSSSRFYGAVGRRGLDALRAGRFADPPA